jgi:hypothetical protein
MERPIDKIDVELQRKELIALYYRIELKSLLQRLLAEHYQYRSCILK